MEILKDFAPTSAQIDKFERYYQNLISFNQHTNLTAITDKEEVFVKHFYDSCLGASLIEQNASVLDIGTGAGFPGVPLKILREDINLYLVDSLNKRINFLNQLKTELNINYKTEHSRAEDFAHSSNRESFDVVVARAVAGLNTLCEYTLPLVKVGGIFIAYKGSNYQDEIEVAKSAILKLGGKIEFVKEYDLPNNYGKRALIVIRKVEKTKSIYPRGKNLPKLKPLV
ncbi:MAG: 16S rRNA (guanine(527)-N(7))-methyltransferase RsmG [Clostridia bacterium]|nr:16S rRNA (guanine(527)-N(7))-methyltransferase RsmG [Clostridia bacterium]